MGKGRCCEVDEKSAMIDDSGNTVLRFERSWAPDLARLLMHLVCDVGIRLLALGTATSSQLTITVSQLRYHQSMQQTRMKGGLCHGVPPETATTPRIR